MVPEQLPFELHRPDPSTRRFAAVILSGIGGGLLAALVLSWLLARSGAVADTSLSSIRLMYLVTVGTGIVFGAWSGSRWRFSSSQPARPLTDEDLKPLTEDQIEKIESGYRIGTRTFRDLEDAKEYLYHMNVQREMIRKGREAKSRRAP